MPMLISHSQLPDGSDPEPEGRQPALPGVSLGRMGIVLLLGSETMFFFALFGAWMTLVATKPLAIQIVNAGLASNLLALGLSLLLLVAGSAALLIFPQAPRKAALACALAGAAFIVWRIAILLQLAEAGHTARVSVGFAMFYLLAVAHLVHVAVGTVAAGFRAAGSSSRRLDALPPFWHYAPVMGTIIYAFIVLTGGS